MSSWLKTGVGLSIDGTWSQSGFYFYIPQQYVAISRGNTN